MGLLRRRHARHTCPLQWRLFLSEIHDEIQVRPQASMYVLRPESPFGIRRTVIVERNLAGLQIQESIANQSKRNCIICGDTTRRTAHHS